tara:strand:- start:8519 stop:8722 length:204 start_codon:yes stop_codon:yes gene_type:complete
MDSENLRKQAEADGAKAKMIDTRQRGQVVAEYCSIFYHELLRRSIPPIAAVELTKTYLMCVWSKVNG